MSTPTPAPAEAEADPTPTPEHTDGPVPTESIPAAPVDAAPIPAVEPTPDPAPEADDDWSDPERGREAKRKANQEARKLRGEIAALKEQLEARVDPTEAAAAIELVRAESDRTVARLRFGHQYGLPDEVTDLLQGDTAEEIEAHAKRLAPLVGGSGGSLGRGGLDPTEGPVRADPKKLAAQIPRLH